MDGDTRYGVRPRPSFWRTSVSLPAIAGRAFSRVLSSTGHLLAQGSCHAVTLLHVATAPHARNASVGTQLLGAVRRAVPAGLPIVAKTDQDAVRFYTSNNFAVTSLGEKYPGVERFRVHLRAPANPEPDA